MSDGAMDLRHHLELSVEEGGGAVELALSRDGRRVFGARLEAPELDELIRALALGRAQLADAVAPELDQGARLADATVDPAYLVGTNDAKGRALLALRHPGFGWLAFQLRRPVVEQMVARLTDWLARPPGR